MNDPFGSMQKVVVCRPAREADTSRVMELTRTIWDGHDYVPYAWEEWLRDPDGLLAVAEYGGQVAGLIKLTRVKSDQWWLEGLRVDPQLQGQGIASHLFDYILEAWQEKTVGPVRLLTSSQRLPVHHLCDRTGFKKLGEYGIFGAPTLAGEGHHFTTIAAYKVGAAAERFQHSPLVRYHLGLVDLGWQWAEASEKVLSSVVQENRLWQWRGGEGLLAGFEDIDDDQKFLHISSLYCPLEKVPEILLDYRRLGSALGYPEVRWTARFDDQLVKDLEKAGFKLAWDDRLYIYEKTHP